MLKMTGKANHLSLLLVLLLATVAGLRAAPGARRQPALGSPGAPNQQQLDGGAQKPGRAADNEQLAASVRHLAQNLAPGEQKTVILDAASAQAATIPGQDGSIQQVRLVDETLPDGRKVTYEIVDELIDDDDSQEAETAHQEERRRESEPSLAEGPGSAQEEVSGSAERQAGGVEGNGQQSGAAAPVTSDGPAESGTMKADEQKATPTTPVAPPTSSTRPLPKASGELDDARPSLAPNGTVPQATNFNATPEQVPREGSAARPPVRVALRGVGNRKTKLVDNFEMNLVKYPADEITVEDSGNETEEVIKNRALNEIPLRNGSGQEKSTASVSDNKDTEKGRKSKGKKEDSNKLKEPVDKSATSDEAEPEAADSAQSQESIVDGGELDEKAGENETETNGESASDNDKDESQVTTTIAPPPDSDEDHSGDDNVEPETSSEASLKATVEPNSTNAPKAESKNKQGKAKGKASGDNKPAEAKLNTEVQVDGDDDGAQKSQTESTKRAETAQQPTSINQLQLQDPQQVHGATNPQSTSVHISPANQNGGQPATSQPGQVSVVTPLANGATTQVIGGDQPNELHYVQPGQQQTIIQPGQHTIIQPVSGQQQTTVTDPDQTVIIEERTTVDGADGDDDDLEEEELIEIEEEGGGGGRRRRRGHRRRGGWRRGRRGGWGHGRRGRR